MAFSKGAAGVSGSTAPKSTAPVNKLGVPKYTLRMLPAGSVADEESGKKPWIYLATIWEKESENKKGEKYKSYSGKTRVAEDDPDFTEDQIKLKVIDGQPTLCIQKGKRIPDKTNKPNKAKDGKMWLATDDETIVCVLTKEKNPQVNTKFFGDDAEGNRWELLNWKSKEERANGPTKRFNAAEVFG